MILKLFPLLLFLLMFFCINTKAQTNLKLQSKKPIVMLNHDPFNLMKMEESKTVDLINFQNDSIIMVFDSDRTTGPTGCLIDTKFPKNIEQTFLTSKPGYILFENICEAMEINNMVVYRAYNRNFIDKNIKTLHLRLDDFEFHQYLTKDDKLYSIARVNISLWSLEKSENNFTITAKTLSSNDIFSVLANLITKNIQTKILK